ncbi:MAG: nucleotidyl transferase AbiEii/AbiGii toxin family protein [Thiotrichaceae bacterium]|nr:nucleotidyl transferase AbiEii/AbiGii toxin family protein [Thiotrichaceae bacterium]PCI13095.1 MAG: hypothetical protein COB71_07020 [Thiotrichales bacterium]
MENIARLSSQQRAELFSETAAIRAMTPAIVEKDFWVTWLLGRLFNDEVLKNLLMFKGGTSLSKAYGLIERFSEDVDLVLNWHALTAGAPMAERSKTQQAQLNKKMTAAAEHYIAGELLTRMNEVVGDVCRCELDDVDRDVINLYYPAAFADDYLRPEVRLEIGPLASWLPNQRAQICSYAAEAFPDLFDSTHCAVQVIQAERTFWEKATILHVETYRPDDRPLPPRYFRHYYDLAQMACTDVKTRALAADELLADVVTFKQRFYPRGWAHYELAVRGTLRLVPAGNVLAAVAADYRAMRDMIFGEVPTFEQIMQSLQLLEDEINRKEVHDE